MLFFIIAITRHIHTSALHLLFFLHYGSILPATPIKTTINFKLRLHINQFQQFVFAPGDFPLHQSFMFPAPCSYTIAQQFYPRRFSAPNISHILGERPISLTIPGEFLLHPLMILFSMSSYQSSSTTGFTKISLQPPDPGKFVLLSSYLFSTISSLQYLHCL